MDPATIALLASLAPALLNIGGSKGETKSTYSKEQRKGISDIFQTIKGLKGGGAADVTQQAPYQEGLDWLMGMFNDPEFFRQFEAPLQRQFQEQTVPDLANRFASMGSGGALGSTGFRNQLAREGSNLGTNIAALRGGMQQQAIPQLFGAAQQPFANLMNLLQTGLGHPTENVYQPPSNPFAPIAGAAAQGFFQNRGFPGQSQSTL